MEISRKALIACTPISQAKINERYHEGKRLERALGVYSLSSHVAFNKDVLYGGNFLNYSFTATPLSDICQPGTLYTLTLKEYENERTKYLEMNPNGRLLDYFEQVAGAITLKQINALNYMTFTSITDAHLQCYVTYDCHIFYDHMISVARKIYSEFFADPIPKLSVTKTIFAE